MKYTSYEQMLEWEATAFDSLDCDQCDTCHEMIWGRWEWKGFREVFVRCPLCQGTGKVDPE